MAGKGFSLAELLMVLLILGEIAAFTIPKVLQSQQSAQKKAIFKEVYAALFEVYHTGKLSGQGVDNEATYARNTLNAVKVCHTNANTQNCFPQAGPRNTEPGLVLHNGATIAGFNVNGASIGNDNITIDWNGPTGPNTVGDDQIQMTIYFGSMTCANATLQKPLAILPGVCGTAEVAGSPMTNTQLYQWIFN